MPKSRPSHKEACLPLAPSVQLLHLNSVKISAKRATLSRAWLSGTLLHLAFSGFFRPDYGRVLAFLGFTMVNLGKVRFRLIAPAWSHQCSPSRRRQVSSRTSPSYGACPLALTAVFLAVPPPMLASRKVWAPQSRRSEANWRFLGKQPWNPSLKGSVQLAEDFGSTLSVVWRGEIGAAQLLRLKEAAKLGGERRGFRQCLEDND